jgi:hypothetical protein
MDDSETALRATSSAEEVELVRRIVATQPFLRSAHLTRFLLYICDCKWDGRQKEITEHQIGVQALGRKDNYNPGDDNIVRNYARILRKRLDEYFSEHGQNEALRIEIPVGHYFPSFVANTTFETPVSTEWEDTSAHLPSAATAMKAVKTHKEVDGSRPGFIWAVAAIAAAVALTVCFKGFIHKPSPYALFWQQILDRNRPTFLVPGDSGFSMLQDISGTEVHLNDYISGDFQQKFRGLNLTARKDARFGPDRFSSYTSTADLAIALGIAHIAQEAGAKITVRYARDMRMQDLKGANTILIGAPHANPWDEIFEPESSFRMVFPMHLDGMHIDGRYFVNKHPRAGEQPIYENQTLATSRLAYTLISFLPGAGDGNYVLMLQGQNMPGTQAAGDFLLDQGSMEPILRKALLADGRIGPFEILLEARAVGANAAETHAVVERFGINTH